MTSTHRLEQALHRLNELIDQGQYFNPAIGKVCTRRDEQ
jgi:conjugal transfer/entry exclusion protein